MNSTYTGCYRYGYSQQCIKDGARVNVMPNYTSATAAPIYNLANTVVEYNEIESIGFRINSTQTTRSSSRY